MLPFPVLFLVVVTVVSLARAQQPSCPASYAWMDNAEGQDPCAVYSAIMTPCEGHSWSLPPLTNPGSWYSPSSNNEEDPCQCSTVSYNLLQACAVCQQGAVVNWTLWYNVIGCQPAITNYAKWPWPIPSDTGIPAWAMVNAADDGPGFSESEARQIASLGLPDIAGSTTVYTTISLTLFATQTVPLTLVTTQTVPLTLVTTQTVPLTLFTTQTVPLTLFTNRTISLTPSTDVSTSTAVTSPSTTSSTSSASSSQIGSTSSASACSTSILSQVGSTSSASVSQVGSISSASAYQDESTPIGPIIGGAIGGAALLAFVALIAAFLIMRERRKPSPNQFVIDPQTNTLTPDRRVSTLERDGAVSPSPNTASRPGTVPPYQLHLYTGWTPQPTVGAYTGAPEIQGGTQVVNPFRG